MDNHCCIFFCPLSSEALICCQQRKENSDSEVNFPISSWNQHINQINMK